jgi:copper homeostasis protein CutC
MTMRRTLEICVEDIQGIDAAVAGGADRIELCAALSVGGLTPPVSLVRAAADAPLPVHLLCRPREGDFVYTRAEQALIAEDIRTAAETGLAGIVIGANAGTGLDTTLLAALVAHARALGEARGHALSLTLHRAFDLCHDLPSAMESATELGFDRILTSGGTPKAVDGVPALTQLHAQAAGRIVILAGSGVSPTTLPAILTSGVYEVHASCRQPEAGPADADALRFGFVSPDHARTNVDMVRQLAVMLRIEPDLSNTNL